ncbi:13608_t:CDS:2, partial [Gigaspora rosea]
MTAVAPKDITNVVPTDDRKIMSNSEAKVLKNTCSVLLSPLYAPVAKSVPVNNQFQHLESDNLIWESRATKFFDFGDYFTYAANKLFGGGSFKNNSTTTTSISSSSIDAECDNGVVNEGPCHQALYSIAFAKPLVIPSA